jgi:hypothetical protein
VVKKYITKGTAAIIVSIWEGKDMASEERRSVTQPAAKLLSHKLLSFEVKVIDKCVPDKLLLFYLNLLDKHVPTKVFPFVIEGIEKYVPHKLRSSLITAADEYVPDTASSSRKVCAVVAAVGKYIPDRIIPPKSLERWENLRMKFHIPRLISMGWGKHRRG